MGIEYKTDDGKSKIEFFYDQLEKSRRLRKLLALKAECQKKHNENGDFIHTWQSQEIQQIEGKETLVTIDHTVSITGGFLKGLNRICSLAYDNLTRKTIRNPQTKKKERVPDIYGKRMAEKILVEFNERA